MIRKGLLAAVLAIGGLFVSAMPAAATPYNVIYMGTYPSLAECTAAGLSGLAAGWEDYRCHNLGGPHSLLQIVYLH